MLGVDGVFVHPLGGQGIVHIANGKDASVKANIFTCKLVGVARAIVSLVVLQNGQQYFLRKFARASQLFVAALHMGAHDLHFAGVELARRVQYGCGQQRLAVIVKHGGYADKAQLFFLQPQILPKRHGKNRHIHAVARHVVVQIF